MGFFSGPPTCQVAILGTWASYSHLGALPALDSNQNLRGSGPRVLSLHQRGIVVPQTGFEPASSITAHDLGDRADTET